MYEAFIYKGKKQSHKGNALKLFPFPAIFNKNVCRFLNCCLLLAVCVCIYMYVYRNIKRKIRSCK